MILNRESLASLNPIIEHHLHHVSIKPRIAHIGFNDFHRAHQLLLTDKLANDYKSDWGYCEIDLTHSKQELIALKNQDQLYSAVEISDYSYYCRIIDVIKTILHIDIDGVNAIIAALSSPEIAIVSMTLSEQRYYQQDPYQLDIQHPLIAHDIRYPYYPLSLPGILLTALYHRYIHHLPGFTLLSCDNIPFNGKAAAALICQLAQQQQRPFAFIQWLATKVSFPSSILIKNVYAKNSPISQSTQQNLGVDDHLAVICEPYTRWIIEDNFTNGRPAWEKVGVEFVNEIAPYQLAKQRIIDGSEIFMAYCGLLSGHRYLHECMQDPYYILALRKLILHEQAPTIPTQQINSYQEIDQLVTRYSNSKLHHSLLKIFLLNYNQLASPFLESIRWHLQHNSKFELLALAIASWLHLLINKQYSSLIYMDNPLYKLIQIKLSYQLTTEDKIDTLLSIPELFSEDLYHNEKFIITVIQAYFLLEEQGISGALKIYLRYY